MGLDSAVFPKKVTLHTLKKRKPIDSPLVIIKKEEAHGEKSDEDIDIGESELPDPSIYQTPLITPDVSDASPSVPIITIEHHSDVSSPTESPRNSDGLNHVDSMEHFMFEYPKEEKVSAHYHYFP